MHERIRQARIAAKMSQAELGEKVGYTKNYINLIENNKRNPSALLLEKFAEILGVNASWLASGEGEMKPTVTRETELGNYVKEMLSDSPDSFRTALVTTLLRFDPNGPEWAVIERIFEKTMNEMKRAGE